MALAISYIRQTPSIIAPSALASTLFRPRTTTIDALAMLRRPFLMTPSMSTLTTASTTAASLLSTQQRKNMSTTGSPNTNTEHVRPISPHVTIYRFPFPAIMSIMNRATGVGLHFGVAAISLLALFGSCDIPGYVASFQTAAPILQPLVKAVVAFPFIFHYAGGLRHLYWDDTAKGIELDKVHLSGKIMLGCVGVATLFAAMITL